MYCHSSINPLQTLYNIPDSRTNRENKVHKHKNNDTLMSKSNNNWSNFYSVIMVCTYQSLTGDSDPKASINRNLLAQQVGGGNEKVLFWSHKFLTKFQETFIFLISSECVCQGKHICDIQYRNIPTEYSMKGSALSLQKWNYSK